MFRCLRGLMALWLLALAFAGVQAQSLLQPIPTLTSHVVDTSGTLDTAQKAALEAKLAALEAEKGSQVVLLLVPTTAPEDIAEYANRVGNAWKIGRREVGDGIIVLVAVQDRRMRIEVAKALEGAVPDIAAKQIIDDAMAPSFRRGDYAGGLSSAVDQLAARVRGEALPPIAPRNAPSGQGSDFGGFGLFEGLILLLVAFPIINAVARGIFGRKLGALATGGGVGVLTFLITASLVLAAAAGVIALLFALFAGVMSSLPSARPGGRGGWGGPVILPPSGGGWGGGGGFGGGGGWSSGGGGDFGGGGASGSW